jgi:hypothetical protein
MENDKLMTLKTALSILIVTIGIAVFILLADNIRYWFQTTDFMAIPYYRFLLGVVSIFIACVLVDIAIKLNYIIQKLRDG